MPPKSRKKTKAQKAKAPEQIKRSFVEAESISKHLICSICYEVFNDPVHGDCQHIFCRVCITHCFGKKQTISCPIDRKPIKKAQLQKSMLAYQIINDLQIFCCNEGCEWKGSLDAITHHLPNCALRPGALPDWFV